MRTRAIAAWASSIALATVGTLRTTEALATPGTHPPLVHTWDTRASSVNGAFTAGLFPGGHLYFGSYNSSFSSTSGNVSAQFGVHYVNYLQAPQLPAANGGSGSASFVYSVPILDRHETGLPRLALGFYVGTAPTLLIAGERNYVWVPLALGVAAPISPVRFLTIVPSFEVAGGVTLDTVIRAPNFKPTDAANFIGPDGNVRFSQADIERLVGDALTYELAGAVTVRGGVAAAFHLGERVDLGADIAFGNVGGLSDGVLAVFAGAKLQLHWDNVVPAVLPARERLERESCEDVEERWRKCPGAKSSQKALPQPAAPAKAPDAPPIAPSPATPEPTPPETTAP